MDFGAEYNHRRLKEEDELLEEQYKNEPWGDEMKLQDIIDYCSSKHKSYIDYPFGEIPICFKLSGKLFAQIYPKEEDYKITLKCELMTADFYRQIYLGIVVRGYHCPSVQQPFWNTIYIDRISDDELLNMIDHAYECILKSFSKKKQKDLNDCN